MSANFGTINRREMLRNLGLGLLGTSCASWLPALAAEVAQDPRRRRHCILLWMSGGPSQTDTFDMKPNDANGGEFKEIATSVPGLRFSEHLPKLAKQAERLGDRPFAEHEGRRPCAWHVPGSHGSLAGRRSRVSIDRVCACQRSALGFGAAQLRDGCASARYQSGRFRAGLSGHRVRAGHRRGKECPCHGRQGSSSREASRLEAGRFGSATGVSPDETARRMALWKSLEHKFLESRHGESFDAHNALYRKAAELMKPDVRTAFDLSKESDKVRERYGSGVFGQGCLLARRLVERGVPFVEVGLGDVLGWDTHTDNFRRVKTLSTELDTGWATLMSELQDRGLLESTTILWASEFGRTPMINNMAGRDHFPAAWTCVFAGGGIHGGQAYGRTSKDGTAIEDKQVGIGDVLATLCTALGVPPDHENITPSNRPIKLAEGKPIREILA